METPALILMSVLIAGLTAGGWVLTAAIDPAARGSRRLGESFLFGCGGAGVALLLVAIAMPRWSLLSLAVVFLSLIAATWLLCRRRIAARKFEASPPCSAPESTIGRIVAVAADATTAFSLFCHALFATIAPLWEMDFWAVWGLKARIFFEAGGIDRAFLQNPDNIYAHPDYPPLWPLLLDVAALCRGAWDDRWIGLYVTALAAALLLIVRSMLQEEFGSRPLAALGTLGIAGLVLADRIGFADGPLVAFATAGALLLRRALRHAGEGDSMLPAGLLLGFAALTKNEGMTIALAVYFAAAIDGRFRLAVLRRLWPAALSSALLVLPWLILRSVWRLPTDIFTGQPLVRAWDRLTQPRQFFGALFATNIDRPLLWLVIVAGLVLAGSAGRRSERFLIFAAAFQIAIDLAVYAMSPHEVVWHMGSSWHRLVYEVWPIAAFAMLAALAPHLKGRAAALPSPAK